jgi:hypothetical protein
MAYLGHPVSGSFQHLMPEGDKRSMLTVNVSAPHIPARGRTVRRLPGGAPGVGRLPRRRGTVRKVQARRPMLLRHDEPDTGKWIPPFKAIHAQPPGRSRRGILRRTERMQLTIWQP